MFDAPAVGRLTVTSPRDLATFRAYNAMRPYSSQVKPWGFLNLAHAATHERAAGVGTLIAPFERDPTRRRTAAWIDRDQPAQPPRRIHTSPMPEICDNSTAVFSYRDYFEQYRHHPEALDPADGQPCHPWTRGLLAPWHICATDQRRVGKESNRLSDAQLPADDAEEQVIEYPVAQRKRRGCDAIVTGRRQWCSDACRKRATRLPRRKAS